MRRIGFTALAALGTVAVLGLPTTTGAATVEGTAVRVSSNSEGLVVDLLVEGNRALCEAIHVPASMRLSDRHSKLVLRTPDVCHRGGWRRSGIAHGVVPSWEVLANKHWAGSQVYLSESILPATREYRLVIRLGVRRLTGWLTVHHRLQSYERIYEGTDAFINYCIDRGATLHSSHHRLYCTREIAGRSFMAIHPSRWH